MAKFKVTITLLDRQITTKEVKDMLDEYFMMKLKMEGISFKHEPIKVEELIEQKINVEVANEQSSQKPT